MNDLVYAALIAKGYTGDVHKMLLQFYRDNGATSDSLNSAEKEFLEALGTATGTLQDRWYIYLLSEGYSGSLQDMIRSWWAAGAPLTPSTPQAFTLEDGSTALNLEDNTTALETEG